MGLLISRDLTPHEKNMRRFKPMVQTVQVDGGATYRDAYVRSEAALNRNDDEPIFLN